MYKQNSEFKSIQKKLVGAVAMVLVACIMVVSSSYAWFTLSTAPEVTGIQTSVGSNGNLEIALRQAAGDLNSITTTTNSNGTWKNNIFWGNLVDLSDSSYGLSKISLAPARLNVTTNTYTTEETVVVADLGSYGTDDGSGNVKVATDAKYNGFVIKGIAKNDGTNAGYTITYYKVTSKSTVDLSSDAQQLMTPVYGPDGRISAIEANTSAASFLNNAFSGDQWGVRGIGTVSGLSDAQIALRDAKAAVKASIEAVRAAAQNSMNLDAPMLADIILKYAIAAKKDTVAYNATEVKAVSDAVASLQAIVVDLKSTLDQAVIAISMSQEGDDVTTVTMTASGFTTDKTIVWDNLVDVKASLDEAYADLFQMNKDLTDAQSNLPTLTEGQTTSFTTIRESLDYLMSVNHMSFYVGEKGPYTADDLRTQMKTLFNDLISNDIVAKISGGIYVQIAEFIENYKGSTKLKVSPADLGVTGFDTEVEKTVILETAAVKPSKGWHLLYASNWLGTIQITGEAGSTSISDLYGYLIDLAFRTNATGSSLMLQTSAVNRLESSGQTQGSGSYMEFTIGHTDYTQAQMVELMKAIRVVFVNEDGEIIAVGGLDMGSTDAVPHYQASADGKTIKAQLRLFDYTISGNGAKIEMGTMINYTDDEKQATALMELIANEPTALSTLVYLDGDVVENGDVAISGNSITGTMNLQFSSSAALDPMDYTFTEQLQTLDAPKTATLTDTSLLIEAADNAPAGVKYQIYVKVGENLVPVGSPVEAGTRTVSLNGVDDVTAGTSYEIHVKAVLTGYADSNAVKAGDFTVPTSNP